MSKPRLIVISGKQGSGKTTLARALQAAINRRNESKRRGHASAIISKFAAPLYTLHDEIYSLLERYDVKRPAVKDGELLQLLGTQWGRSVLGEDIWARICRQEAEQNLAAGYNVIIDDLRFKNELETFIDAFKVRLECPREMRKKRCEAWREDESHPSETDLDSELRRFDLVIPTDMIATPYAVKLIYTQIFVD
jgi:deoxyadenosine/deoxycytidine kinase